MWIMFLSIVHNAVIDFKITVHILPTDGPQLHILHVPRVRDKY